MSALLTTQPQTTAPLTPVDLPRLRAVSTRAAIDVPVLEVTPVAQRKLRAVASLDTAPHERAQRPTVLDRAAGILKVGVIVAAAVTFALSLELWLTF